MAKKMLIDATHAEETRVVVVDGNKVEEFDFETAAKRQLAGNIYLAKVTRVEPSLQAAFVDYGGNRHGFLAFSEIHPDYYQIPTADRQALLEEERAYARQQDEDETEKKSSSRKRRSRSRKSSKPEAVASDDAVETAEVEAAEGNDIAGMGVVDLGEDTGADALFTDEAGTDDGHDHGHDHDDDEDGAEDASDKDTEIESVAEEDVAEEIRQPRKPRPRKYKIQEVVKVRQIMLVQVVKEERGNKGAALTTYLSLAGRYCVLMPNTARGGGISRKITQAADRKKLKEIASEIEVPEGAGLIIRTAGAKRTKAEIKRDYEYLMRMWEQIRDLTLKSIAPAPIYEEGNLIKRSIRDLYNRDIDEVLVEGGEGYRVAKDFMKMIMPSHAKNVKQYADPLPLFARYQVETYLGGMFNPVVQLKSGGYIVIGVTEALVAIDVNSGRATKEGSIEDTATKTNLEAAEEIARQLRLRDLAGLIVIDFIDMEERKNNAAVEKKLKDKLKTDRARIQVGRISGFGLLEMSRQRLRPGMLESTTQPCAHCHGTGLIRSDDSLALQILRALEEEGTRKRSKEVLLKAPIAIVNFLMNQKREHIAQIEARYGMSVRIEADPSLISPDFTIEKFKTATRVVELAPVVSIDTSVMPDLEEEDEDDIVEAEDEAEEAAEESRDDTREESREDGEGQPTKKKRRRRRRRRGGGNGQNGGAEQGQDGDEAGDADAGETEAAGTADDAPVTPEPAPVTTAEPVAEAPAEEAPAAEAPDAAAEATPETTAEVTGEEAPKKKTVSRSSRSRSKKKVEAAETTADGAATVSAESEATDATPEVASEAPKKKPSSRSRSSTAKSAASKSAPKSTGSKAAKEGEEAAEGEKPVKARSTRSRAKKKVEEAAPAAEETPVEAPVAETPAPAPEPAPAPAASEPAAEPAPQPTPEPAPAGAEPEEDGRPKRTGWWSR
ncbi:Rne/Rng family ribonuclease [Acidimangrovimonas sediminis]|uniref:Rne/Rng family ribonuclease n=1 Tax=Acidimangrovimonas sediminis TaxID=2056283 RepID=UPI000C80619E|nr:ribonuclease E/G [Acidimangrovimonas sediminis]